MSHSCCSRCCYVIFNVLILIGVLSHCVEYIYYEVALYYNIMVSKSHLFSLQIALFSVSGGKKRNRAVTIES